MLKKTKFTYRNPNIYIMKKIVFLAILTSLFAAGKMFSQQVNGEIISDQNNLTVVKLWGSHQERGYAYGYLCAQKIKNLYDGYLAPQFGSGLASAKQLIQQGQVLTIAPEYIVEAQAIVDGMTAAGETITNGDYLDILVANSFLDLMGLNSNFGSKELKNGCSSLMTWGDATTGSVDAGKAYVSRHLDWSTSSYLTNNQVLVIHLPSEADEQPWAMIGFAGQMSVLSGANDGGMAAFQHMLSDFNETGTMNPPYDPIWFSLRRALEKSDYNGDGLQDVNDVRSALAASSHGYSEGYIVAALAKADQVTDSLIALVAEVTPNSPTHTYRYNNYADMIPGDNLYAANYEIKRNDHHHYCSRYNNIISSFTDSTAISMADNWDKMRLYSNSGTGNIQFMQFCPDDRLLKLAWNHDLMPGYQNEPDTFHLDELFSPTVSIQAPRQVSKRNSLKLKPNPASNYIYTSIYLTRPSSLTIIIHDSQLNLICQIELEEQPMGHFEHKLNIQDSPVGTYILTIKGDSFSVSKKFVKY